MKNETKKNRNRSRNPTTSKAGLLAATFSVGNYIKNTEQSTLHVVKYIKYVYRLF